MKKLTKKDRKRQGRNYFAQSVLSKGKKVMVGETEYKMTGLNQPLVRITF